MSRRSSLVPVIWVGIAVVALGLAAWVMVAMGERYAVSAVAPREVAARGSLTEEEESTIRLFEQSRVSVVYITTQSRVVDPWTRNVFNIPRGTGSGFVWDEGGNIVTNYHVVADASGARVRLSDGRDASATLVGVSPAHDLAVIRVDVSKLPQALPIGTSHDLKVGQRALAIGNPFGLDWTLTTGIISALDRALPSEDGSSLIEHLIQTDAAINPGNSGGPLLDSAGRLIGVNPAIFSPSGASAGVGFAVPVDTVNRVVPQLVETGKYVRPTLGIQVDEELNRLVTERVGTQGVSVLRVTPGSAAAAAGLQGVQQQPDGSIVPGDIIVALDGREIESVARLLGRLDDYKVGDVVRLTIVRDGRRTEVPVTLQAAGK